MLHSFCKVFPPRPCKPCKFRYCPPIKTHHQINKFLFFTGDHLHNLPTLGAPPPDLYDWAAASTHRLGRPSTTWPIWRVVDDWPARVPVTPAEVDVFEAWSAISLTSYSAEALAVNRSGLCLCRCPRPTVFLPFRQFHSRPGRAALSGTSGAERAARPRIIGRVRLWWRTSLMSG